MGGRYAQTDNIPSPKLTWPLKQGSSPNHHFSGATFVSRSVILSIIFAYKKRKEFDRSTLPEEVRSFPKQKRWGTFRFPKMDENGSFTMNCKDNEFLMDGGLLISNPFPCNENVAIKHACFFSNLIFGGSQVPEKSLGPPRRGFRSRGMTWATTWDLDEFGVSDWD